MYIYIYIYICVCVCVCIDIYIYVYITYTLTDTYLAYPEAWGRRMGEGGYAVIYTLGDSHILHV